MTGTRRGSDRVPQTPAELSNRTWLGTFKRTLREFKQDDPPLNAPAAATVS